MTLRLAIFHLIGTLLVCVILSAPSIRSMAWAAQAEDNFALAPTVLGQTGGLTVTTADVLFPWTARFGVIASLSSGSWGNGVDGFTGRATDPDRLLILRGALTLGLPREFEASVVVPYGKITTGGSTRDGPGDVTVSIKRRLRTQEGWVPATAVSAGWIADTARHDELRSVTTNGFLASATSHLKLKRGDWTWTVSGELGGYWRDPGRPEGDASVVYGVAWILPLAKTGKVYDTGEVQFLAELSGTAASRDLTGLPNDVTSLSSGIRYLAEGWGFTLSGFFATYEHADKTDGKGGIVEAHLSF